MQIVVKNQACSSVQEVRRYIENSWSALRRTEASVVKFGNDIKVAADERVRVYVPPNVSPEAIADRFRNQLDSSDFQKMEVLQLPERGEPSKPGLLYLPNPYIVPGGRFNEMYGWDSYFIVRGLLQDGQIELAKGMTDNLIFEVRHYGKVLNANRTYYLTRSQPPFLSSMVREVYGRTHDRAWLQDTIPALEDYYRYWTSEPHLTPETGLSRYEGGADTPAPEVLASESDIHGRNDYERIRRYFSTHNVETYQKSRFYDEATGQLTPLFYRADRAMRESGFDPSSRFGPFSAAILDYNPVDLNSLLYLMETDVAAIHKELGRAGEAGDWTARAQRRAEAINRLMWDEPAGLFFDYDLRNHRRSHYKFLTAFYPLWTGLASQEQASRVNRNLALFDRPGGLQTSAHRSGDQWDAPFGWAPLQLIAAEGLRRYGFDHAADRISIEFLSMLVQDFRKHKTLREKYDVVTLRSDLAAGLKFGYSSNEVGFGWTNAVFEVLYAEFSPSAREHLNQTCRTGH